MCAEQLPGTSSVHEVQAAAHASGLRTGPLAGIVLAFVGGAVTWVLVETFHPVFHVPEQYAIPDLGAPAEKFEKLRIVQAKVDRCNAMFDLGLFGALVAGSIAAGETIARRSLKPVVVAAPVGALFGCLAAVCGSIAHELCDPLSPPANLTDTVVVQGVMFAILGGGSGLAVGASGRSARIAAKAMIVGALAGALAGMLYPFAVSIVLPTVNTKPLIPSGTLDRLLWIELAAGLLGSIIFGMARGRTPCTKSNEDRTTRGKGI